MTYRKQTKLKQLIEKNIRAVLDESHFKSIGKYNATVEGSSVVLFSKGGNGSRLCRLTKNELEDMLQMLR